MKITKSFCAKVIFFCMLAIISICPIVVFVASEKIRLPLCIIQAILLGIEYVFLWLRSKADE